MAESAYIFEATPDNFTQLVLDNSERGLVLVNFWAPWAGPCLKLWPALEQLATQYAGRFLLVNVNTDQHKALARECAVTSLPTLKLYRRRTVVDAVHGAESEQSLRALIDKHVTRPSDRRLAEAVTQYQRGAADTAFALLAQAAADDPDNTRIPLTHAKLLMSERRPADVQRLIEALPQALREQPAFAHLHVHAGFLIAAAGAPAVELLAQRIADNPDDLVARHQLSALQLLNDDYEPALEQLLEIVRRDRSFMDDVGRRGLMALFALLGPEHALTQRYRTLLHNALH